MVTFIVALFFLGLCFISFELIVPGGIFGILGVLAVMGSWGLAFWEYGPQGGLLAVFIGVFVITITLVVELKFLPKTAVGRRLFLNDSIGATSQRPVAESSLVGKEGETLTTLAPTGMVLVEGRKYEGFSMSGLVERGTQVQVVDYDNFRVRVKKI